MDQTKKFLKKKERERRVRKEVLHRREVVRRENKEKRLNELRQETEFQLRNGKPEPILTDPEAIKAREEMKKVQVEKRLKHNLAILEALEKEYDQEKGQRQDANEALESEGHKTIQDKLTALAARAKKMQSISDALTNKVTDLGDEQELEPLTIKDAEEIVLE
jgi:hypothetical protein